MPPRIVKKVPRERKMTIVEYPEKITFPVLQKPDKDLSPFFEGTENGMDFVCGSCNHVLIKNVRIVSLPILAVYRCPQCEQLNTL
ncbi:hypothetical protein PN4B1_06670 [Paenibacillus naphthalenovorans]|nr:hypothetical protein PN4B1_06670 [Paenibacillus naphthalenovorans]SDI23842.1 hypothetical protein SAMN05421868_104172 [Paenibacillus naphthalenovorans]